MAQYKRKSDDELVEASQWFEVVTPKKGERRDVGYYRPPHNDGLKRCGDCNHPFKNHGSKEGPNGSVKICPGDFIVKFKDSHPKAYRALAFLEKFTLVPKKMAKKKPRAVAVTKKRSVGPSGTNGGPGNVGILKGKTKKNKS